MSSLRWVSHQPQMQQVPRGSHRPRSVFTELTLAVLANEAHVEIERKYRYARERTKFIAAGIRPEAFPEVFAASVALVEAGEVFRQVATSFEAFKRALSGLGEL